MAPQSARVSNRIDSANGSVAPRSSHHLETPRPSPQDVAERAYDKFIRRGYLHGFDQQDWVVAERELAAEHMADSPRKSDNKEEQVRAAPAGVRHGGSEALSLRSLKDLEHYTVSGTDGDIGHVVNFLVDDQSWTVRYMVVEAGTFFDGHRVLVSPNAFREVDWPSRIFHLSLTMEMVKNAPSVDTDLPVSRQKERAFHDYYGYPYYWGVGSGWGMGVGTFAGGGVNAFIAGDRSEGPSGDVHLRSAKDLRGYHIQGTDDGIGHVKDFVVEDRTWGIRYLIVDTSNWGFGKKVLLAPNWASRISWEDRKVFIDLTREAIKNSPIWKGVDALNREYETDLHGHYGRTPYWLADDPGSSRLGGPSVGGERGRP
jgi:hypothetical protein